MNVSEQQQKNRWLSLFSDVSPKWRTISLLGLACLAVVVISWNSRYEAGYEAGAGEGTAYRPLHEQAQVKIATLEKQHEKDSSEPRYQDKK
ncbi:MAG: hypothetical protein KME20_18275 [Kaiparowitsia implicata GSE-PSE-MK54-09C]|jgi:hypothetical protein|nr:hypothetical protein [Kaiparowitsia implicata GSE-PSE-MK54-09C]